jgi:hypothetical protein
MLPADGRLFDADLWRRHPAWHTQSWALANDWVCPLGRLRPTREGSLPRRLSPFRRARLCSLPVQFVRRCLEFE